MKRRWMLIMTMVVLCGYLFSCSAKEDQTGSQPPQSQESPQREPWSLIY